MKLSITLLFLSAIIISCSRDFKKEWINTCRINAERQGEYNAVPTCHRYSNSFHETCLKESTTPSNALNFVSYNSCMGEKIKGERQKAKWQSACLVSEKEAQNQNYKDDCGRWLSRFHDDCLKISNGSISMNIFESEYNSCMQSSVTKEKEALHQAKMRILKANRDRVLNEKQ